MQGFCGRVGTLADIVFPVLLGADFVDHSFVVRLTLSCRRCFRKTSHASLSSWFETHSVPGGPVRGYISGNLLLDVLGRGSIGSVVLIQKHADTETPTDTYTATHTSEHTDTKAHGHTQDP